MASFGLPVMAAKPEISPPWVVSVLSLPALGLSLHLNDQVHLGLTYHSFWAGLAPLGERVCALFDCKASWTGLSNLCIPFNSFLVVHFPHPSLSGVLAQLFFHFLQLLEPVGIPISICNHAIQHGLVNNIHRGQNALSQSGCEVCCMPVFCSSLHRLCNWICTAKAHDSKTQNPELIVLLMLCKCHKLLLVKAHFVFNGKEHPHLKCDKNVQGMVHWPTNPFKFILYLFSIPVRFTLCFFVSLSIKYSLILQDLLIIEWFISCGCNVTSLWHVNLPPDMLEL